MAKNSPIARGDEGKAALFVKRRDGVKQGVNRGRGKSPGGRAARKEGLIEMRDDCPDLRILF
jgi:hypothetical protein